MSERIPETETGQDQSGGLRQRKRRENHNRIAATGLKLFIDNGFEATTLDMIAEAAGISRRTFFHYFKSKEEVLLARETRDFPDALRNGMMKMRHHVAPWPAAIECLLTLASRYETRDSFAIDRLLRSTAALRARKCAFYEELEQVLGEAMDELWPAPEQQAAHRVIAMAAIGVLRLALDDWRRESAMYPVAHYLQNNLSVIESQF
ncbi:TetR/AcrR family transcriptional regulator [Modicisalibacter radicis]|uniref:TetR/AcrR family transcriptional regulator n=1 Tax=Halomonas sp. EAR18 TaxID=2518972 RepID=UPI00109D1E32|nr:TetR/AcrR family transcriptional regulator [Halomonas sp. EAR18]